MDDNNNEINQDKNEKTTINKDKYYLFCDESGEYYGCIAIKYSNYKKVKNEIQKLKKGAFDSELHYAKITGEKKLFSANKIVNYSNKYLEFFVCKEKNKNIAESYNKLISNIYDNKKFQDKIIKIFIEKYTTNSKFQNLEKKKIKQNNINVSFVRKITKKTKNSTEEEVQFQNLLNLADLYISGYNRYLKNKNAYKNTYKDTFSVNLIKNIEKNKNITIFEEKTENFTTQSEVKQINNTNLEVDTPQNGPTFIENSQIIIPQTKFICQVKNEKTKQNKQIKTTDFNALNSEILSHRLSDVIGRYCHLTQEGGGRKKCRCPFHHEKTPSFHLDDNKGLWHCFGCGEGGNVFTFIQKIKGCDFPKAVDELCEIFGIDKSKYIVIKNTEEVEKSKNFYQTMDIVAEFYKENLKNNKEALDYLHLIRDLDDNTLEEFGFGLAGNDINEILEYCKNKGVNEQNLIDCGIIKESENKKKYLFFKDRIMIPIHNTQGKIVAFGGRIYKTGDENAKYLNSSENDYFKKGNILFNFNRAKRKLNKDNYLIIVEGYMDAIALYRYGFTTAIAPLGTSITENHLKTILNYCKEPVFLFDSDNAGKKASMRACEIIFSMLETGTIPKFCTLENAKDADEFLKKYTTKEFEQQLNNSLAINDYLFNNKLQKFDIEDPNQLSIFQKEINEINRKIPDRDLQENYKIFFKEKINKIRQNNLKNYKSNYKIGYKTNNLNNKQKYINKNINTTNESIDFLEKQIVAFCLKNYEKENLLNDAEIFDNIISKLSNTNQTMLTNLVEQENKSIKELFCEKFLSKEKFKILNHIGNINKNEILENLLYNLENKKNQKSKTLTKNIKYEEKKKIIDKKKKMLLEFDD